MHEVIFTIFMSMIRYLMIQWSRMTFAVFGVGKREDKNSKKD